MFMHWIVASEKHAAEKLRTLCASSERPWLKRASAFSLEHLAFSHGGADQLRNAINQIQSLLYAA